jgi:DNA adenine methylase
LKWAGGKGQLLGPILGALPDRISTYYEPFVGGGAVFFALAEAGRFRRAELSDRNPDLVEAYTMVRDRVEALIARLGAHERFSGSSEYYYRVRAQNKAELEPVDRAARLIFLNRTCYNGLYRVNRKGQFNVPFGRYDNPRVCHREGLRAASRALEKVEIAQRDFRSAVDSIGPSDAVYFDPPYDPVSKTASFTAYDSLPFGQAEHRALAQTFAAAVQRGAHAVLSNSDTPFTRSLFQEFPTDTLMVARAINSAATKRGRVPEILVSGAPRGYSRGSAAR